jgi:DNA-directed RNA polymerase subunit M/transcription elongation factor TFIIS
MIFKCSECSGEVKPVKKFDHDRRYNIFICTKCGRERKIEERVINMKDTANLDVIME